MPRRATRRARVGSHVQDPPGPRVGIGRTRDLEFSALQRTVRGRVSLSAPRGYRWDTLDAPLPGTLQPMCRRRMNQRAADRS